MNSNSLGVGFGMDIDREVLTPGELFVELRRDGENTEKVEQLYAGLTVPSYVHGYSLAIEYMVNWFESKFDKDYFKGGIYVDGKHILDDYKRYSRNVVVGQNPRARVAPQVEFDFDRDFVDLYAATPDTLVRRSNYNKSFFRDYERQSYLGMDMEQLRINFNFKVRLNTRAKQLDCYNMMKMNFKVGATQFEDISADFHIPIEILLNVAERAAFDIDRENKTIDNPIGFLNYLNQYSDLPFLFKMRAINQKPEYFIRLTGLYTHIAIRDKLQLDDGERDGKLDTNFHVEMTATLSIPVPAFYIFYAGGDLTVKIPLKEHTDGMIGVYTLYGYDVPKVDKHGWYQVAVTEYVTDDGEEEIDLTPIFSGDNPLNRAVECDMVRGVSPKHFVNVMIFRGRDPMVYGGEFDWKTKIYHLSQGEPSQKLFIAVYMDRKYVNDIEIASRNLEASRIESKYKPTNK